MEAEILNLMVPESLIRRRARIEREFSRLSHRGSIRVTPLLPDRLRITITEANCTREKTIHVNEKHFLREMLAYNSEV